MALTDFRVSRKTKRPGCCDFDCCGNHFGRIEKSRHARVHGQVNRIVKTRRYAKRVERRLTKEEIRVQLNETLQDIEDFNLEMKEMFCDDDYMESY